MLHILYMYICNICTCCYYIYTCIIHIICHINACICYIYKCIYSFMYMFILLACLVHFTCQGMKPNQTQELSVHECEQTTPTFGLVWLTFNCQDRLQLYKQYNSISLTWLEVLYLLCNYKP